MPELEAAHDAAAVEEKSEIIYEKTIKMLKRMTMTVIDAEFPVKFVADDNLYFVPYRMRDSSRNSPEFYDAKMMAGAGKKRGEVFWGTPNHLKRRKSSGWMR